MARYFRRIAGLAAALTVIFGLRPAAADVVKLKNGGQVRGTTQGGTAPDGAAVIETLHGTVVSVGRGDIESIVKRPAIVEQYETLARAAANTVDAQWTLAEWCRTNGLTQQRQAHLERVIQLDPNHEKAHRGLGHALYNGVWSTRDEVMRVRGYVYHKGSYVTSQQLEIILEREASSDAERQWNRKVKLWRGWLTGNDTQKRQTAHAQLSSITDENAVAPLKRHLGDDESIDVRTLFIDILSRVAGEKSLGSLVQQSLRDANAQLRRRALEAIPEQSRNAALSLYVKELRNEQNVVVCRAALALQKLGDENVIPNLIDALVTTHRYRVQVPDNNRMSFGSDGSYSMGGGNQVNLPPELYGLLLTGQLPAGAIVLTPQQPVPMKTVTIVRHQENAEVLAALRKLTGQSLGYDKDRWRQWLAKQKTAAAHADGTT